MGMMISGRGRSGAVRPVAILAGGGDGLPDLQTQLEDLLSSVRACERWARLEDRIDLAVRLLRDEP